MPHLGKSAIDLLVAYLLENDVCTADEKAFFELVRKLTSATDGSNLGIKTADEHFGELTVVGGTICMQDGRVKQTLDSRFPTSTTPEELTSTLAALASEVGADFEATRMVEPFLIDPESGYVQALLSAYNEATGEHAKPFTQGGGTYARKFSCAASFGPEMPWDQMPEWAGGMHGPDETVPEELLKKAFKIYALTIGPSDGARSVGGWRAGPPCGRRVAERDESPDPCLTLNRPHCVLRCFEMMPHNVQIRDALIYNRPLGVRSAKGAEAASSNTKLGGLLCSKQSSSTTRPPRAPN